MLFNSVEFLTLLFPITILGFFLVGRVSRVGAAWWLAGASVVFYGWWSWRFVPLLVGSVVFNFVSGLAIAKLNASGRHAAAKGALVFAIVGDLTFLGYFKYADFLLHSWNAVSDSSIPLLHIILPLGISFFTFTQIAFLVDTYRGIAKEPRFAHFLLFVTYFPHLIAGPVLHHKEMMPQFGHPATYRFSWMSFGLGLAIFCLGLFKKTVLADGIAPHVGPGFAIAARGESLHLLMAWGSALAYSMQLYFDFSGYSDMAIGLSRMFGITLPLNFNSPYKASNISEFWRRWHMTLSRFLRDYLYIPLGGNRHGTSRRFANLIVVMFLGGLWHGAAWTFALWGLLHGLYLVVHEAFKAVCQRLRITGTGVWPTRVAGVLVTYLAVVIGWVLFRAESFHSAFAMFAGMVGANGVVLPDAFFVRLSALETMAASIGVRAELGGGTEFVTLWSKLALLHLIVFLAPNTQEFMRRFSPALDFRDPAGRIFPEFAMTRRWAVVLGAIGGIGLLAMARKSEFLYYQF